ncbi:MAG: sugar ABC transporter substrate-binding protein [Firmicutes bacterium]|nr:sugar ABC transporter substrate-binding protein [Bacillota bacterium]
MKRLFVIGLMLILVLVGVTADAAPKVTLRYALWDSNQMPAMEASIKEFMKQNPDIDVKVELVGWNDYWTKITTGVAAGTLPDVFWGHLAYFSGLITKGALMDLTPYIKRDKVDLSIYYPALVDNWKYKGKQYGIPKDWDTICIFYNKELFDKAGVPYPSEDWSWNPKDGGEFLQIAQKLTIDANGKNATEKGFDKNKIVQFGLADLAAANMQTGWINFVWMNGGTGVIDKPYGTKFVLDQPKAVEAIQFWADLVAKYNVSPATGGQTASSASGWELLKGGKAAMVPQGSWMLSDARTFTFKWDVAMLPKGPAGRYSAFNGLAHNIFAKTKYPEQAWKLAKWMDSYESQRIVSEQGVVFPAIPKLMPVYLAATKAKGPEHVKYFVDETAKSGFWPMHVNWGQISDTITRELDLVFSGSQTAKEAVKNIKMQVDPLLK